MIVADIMTKSVVTATKDDPVSSIVMKMVSRHCGTIPVIGEDNLLIGIVALRDVLIPLYPTYVELLEDNTERDFVSMESGYAEVMHKSVADIMTVRPMTVSPSDPILKAASIMGLKNLRRIPVANEQGILVGVVSIGDINRALFFAAGHKC